MVKIPIISEDIHALVDMQKRLGVFIPATTINDLENNIYLSAYEVSQCTKDLGVLGNMLSCEIIPKAVFEKPCFVLSFKPIINLFFETLKLDYSVENNILAEIYYYYSKNILELRVKQGINIFSGNQDVELASISLKKLAKDTCDNLKISFAKLLGLSYVSDFVLILHLFFKKALNRPVNCADAVLFDIKNGFYDMSSVCERVSKEIKDIYLDQSNPFKEYEWMNEKEISDKIVKDVLNLTERFIRCDEHNLAGIISDNTPHNDFHTTVCIGEISHMLAYRLNMGCDITKKHLSTCFIGNIEEMIKNMAFAPCSNLSDFYAYMLNPRIRPMCLSSDQFSKHLLMYPWIQSMVGYCMSLSCLFGRPALTLEKSYAMMDVLAVISHLVVCYFVQEKDSIEEIITSSSRYIWQIVLALFFPDPVRGFKTIYDGYSESGIRACVSKCSKTEWTFIPSLYSNVVERYDTYMSMEYIRVVNAVVVHYLVRYFESNSGGEIFTENSMDGKLREFNVYEELAMILMP